MVKRTLVRYLIRGFRKFVAPLRIGMPSQSEVKFWVQVLFPTSIAASLVGIGRLSNGLIWFVYLDPNLHIHGRSISAQALWKGDDCMRLDQGAYLWVA